jgi:hypothetical protein
MSLVPVQRAIYLELVLEDPLAIDDIGPKRSRTKFHVLLDSRASYSTIARHRWGSVSALQTEVRTRDSVGGAAAAKSCKRSTGLVTVAARQVTIVWVLWVSRAMATGW